MKKLLVVLVVVLIIAFSLFACVPMQAEAAEEQATASESTYYNYTITCNNAPLMFQYPSLSVVNAQMTSFYNNEILSHTTIDGYNVSFTDMVYVLKHLDGTIYYQSIVRLTNAPGIFMTVGTVNPIPNYSTTVGVNNITSTSFTRITGSESNLFAPNVTFATNNDNYKLKLYFSSIPGNVVLDELVLSAISLHDYLFYAYNPNPYTNNIPLGNGAPWLDFYFTRSTTPNTRQVQVASMSFTQSSEPIYPIVQSYDSIYNYGYNQGYDSGYNTAYDQGYNSGFEVGSDSGYNTGFNNGYNAGEDVGFNQGLLEANDYSFLGLLTAVVDAPVTVIRETFDFNVLGFNLSTFIFSLLTICLVIALIKKLV